MKRVTLFLDEQEEKLLNALMAKYGGKPPAVAKYALKALYEKSFPSYNRVAKELGIKLGNGSSVEVEKKTMTRPEICEMFGGTVDKKNLLGPACLKVKGRGKSDFKTHVPLSDMGRVTDRGDFTVDDIEVVDE